MKTATIKKFLLLGLGAVLVAFVVLGAGWLLSVARLQEMKARLFVDAQSLEYSYRLELLVRSAQNGGIARGEFESDAEKLIAQLPSSVTSPDEMALVQAVTADYRHWRDGVALGATEALLASISEHRALNEAQMRQTMQRGDRLERLVQIWPPLLIGISALALVAGGWKLWSKIFAPMLRLSRAAEAFGKGNLAARAPVMCEDEMGELCRTFNSMADSIRDREQERLQFVATVAHDLKNPMAVIGMAAGLMLRKELPPCQNEQWLERIIHNTRQLEDIIGDLTDGVQAQTGQLELQREEIDLTALAASVVREQDEALHQNGAQSSPHHTLCFAGDTACPILGDRRRLERVLANLISNAVKYSPQKSEVRVTVWRRGMGVRLTVEDQGAGIAPEDLSRLFQPFTRLEGTRHMASGTGLGLVSVKKIIEAHGGDLEIYSRPSHGTIVEIWLKAVPQD